MTATAALKRITAANQQLEKAIEALVAFAPVPDYVEPLHAAASVLQNVSFSELTPVERAQIAEQTRILEQRTTQAERLFELAGMLHLGSLLSSNPVPDEYSPYGSKDPVSAASFHIDG